MAVMEGHDAIVELLIAAKADVNKADDKSKTPLWVAADNGHDAIVELLIAARQGVPGSLIENFL